MIENVHFLIGHHTISNVRIAWYCRICPNRLMFLQGVFYIFTNVYKHLGETQVNSLTLVFPCQGLEITNIEWMQPDNPWTMF